MYIFEGVRLNQLEVILITISTRLASTSVDYEQQIYILDIHNNFKSKFNPRLICLDLESFRKVFKKRNEKMRKKREIRRNLVNKLVISSVKIFQEGIKLYRTIRLRNLLDK